METSNKQKTESMDTVRIDGEDLMEFRRTLGEFKAMLEV